MLIVIRVPLSTASLARQDIQRLQIPDHSRPCRRPGLHGFGGSAGCDPRTWDHNRRGEGYFQGVGRAASSGSGDERMACSSWGKRVDTRGKHAHVQSGISLRLAVSVDALERCVLCLTSSPSASRCQLEFLSDTGRTDDASKLASGTKESLDVSAELLGLSTEELSGALLTRPLQVAREKFVKPNKVGEAQAARDALAKDVYLGIFNYLLKKINEATR